MISKKDLTEEDIKFQYITPSIQKVGYAPNLIKMEYFFTDGKINVRENKAQRSKGKKADYILFYKPNQPIAIIEAKDNKKEVAHGIQQAIDYARILDIPFAYSSNGDAFYEHDMLTGLERQIPLEEFPTSSELWERYKNFKGITQEQEKVINEPYYFMDVEEDRHQKVGKAKMADAIKGFCEYLENKGYYVGIYANSNYFNNFIDTAKLSMYDKWLAVWTSNKPSFKYGDYGLWQNSSSGYISGMRVDTDYAYKDYPSIIKNAGLNGYSKGTPETPKVEPTKKSNDEIATEVINGKWGNGADRKNALTNAGYDYAAIQSIVNARLGVTPKSSAKYHTVVKGDTLWAIAKKYYGDGNRYPEIARANNIANPNIISVGQKLLIP